MGAAKIVSIRERTFRAQPDYDSLANEKEYATFKTNVIVAVWHHSGHVICSVCGGVPYHFCNMW